ncbi:hypothetical protein C8J56DRAFT_500602 [Mycena floridula]|nr:hypothetical protein C8J56DRAFT_500602 [Mycena floridula]
MMYFLGISSLLYVLWTHNSITNVASQASKSLSMKPLQRPASPRIMEARDRRPPVTLVPDKTDFSFIWMSVPKNYRESADDGIVTGLLFGPIIASALLYSSLSQQHSLLPDTWRIESPSVIMNTKRPFTAIEALILSRFNLLDLSTLCSTILLFHTCASWWLESRYRDLNGDGPDGERRSVPRKEGQRSWYYIMFTVSVSLSLVAIKFVLQRENILVWQHLNLLEVAIVLLFYQFTLYVAIRLAHRGFTLGELSLVGFGGTALFMELLNLTMAKIWPVTTPFIKTYRIPNPLLIFQTALIAGSFLTGFLLAPFLVLSRHIAQRPVRRLKYPEQKLRYRRLLALGFYVGAVLVIGGLIGMWTRWCLGRRDPWLWTIFWLLEGRKRWSRSALLIYWAALGSLSIAGWNRQLARSRRYRSLAENAANSDTGESGPSQAATLNLSVPPAVPASSANSLGLNFPNLPNLPNGADLWDVADRHVPTLPTLRLNARRKFFHALAVAMFVPGVALDPAFTHLSFSVAFALFTFAEYVRYFAIYPFGASIHLFLNEFLDHRDGGTAILSHFYLLTGCAGSVWLETSSRLFQFTGILVLGVGDALASIVGKRYGIHSWSPTTSKTLEGSVAFTLSIVACASLLRLCGFVDPFSTLTYLTVVGISSVLEALSDQNDNLTLPLYLWSMLVLVNV